MFIIDGYHHLFMRHARSWFFFSIQYRVFDIDVEGLCVCNIRFKLDAQQYNRTKNNNINAIQ